MDTPLPLFLPLDAPGFAPDLPLGPWAGPLLVPQPQLPFATLRLAGPGRDLAPFLQVGSGQTHTAFLLGETFRVGGMILLIRRLRSAR